MSLIDQAKSIDAEGSIPADCVLAKALKPFPEDFQEEAAQLLRDPEITIRAKWLTLTEAEVVIANRTLHRKMKEGCRCRYCQRTWGGEIVIP